MGNFIIVQNETGNTDGVYDLLEGARESKKVWEDRYPNSIFTIQDDGDNPRAIPANMFLPAVWRAWINKDKPTELGPVVEPNQKAKDKELWLQFATALCSNSEIIQAGRSHEEVAAGVYAVAGTLVRGYHEYGE